MPSEHERSTEQTEQGSNIHTIVSNHIVHVVLQTFSLGFGCSVQEWANYLLYTQM